MKATKKKSLILIQGPTAVGKTSTAIKLAKHFSAEIISSDSRQFYKELNIGVARPTKEELAAVPHHFVAHLSINDYYSVSRFEEDVLDFLEDYFKRKEIIIMVGGSGMYNDIIWKGIDNLPDPDPILREFLKVKLQEEGIESLQKQLKILDPEFYEIVDLNNPKRLMRAVEVCLQTGKKYSDLRSSHKAKRPFNIIKIGLALPREILVDRIHQRVDQMIEEGLEEEVKALLKQKELNALNTVGYKELFKYFEGEWSYELAIEKIKTNTRRFSKRQMTWFRKDKEIRWFSPDDMIGIVEFCKETIAR